LKPNGQVFIRQYQSIFWVRLEGKGTFMVSPSIKEAVERKISEGVREIVVDLEACTGMDSTFMGMLAGIAAKLRGPEGGTLGVVSPGKKNQDSLEELGLSQLLQIEPKEGPWIGKLDEVRADLKPIGGSSPGKEGHILECHENLCEADTQNNERFQAVLDVLRASGK
jgi:anti-sigma B factor antagonist|tara:strand:+ start:1238 stop:1738 length:501 start_codon:yes stop_codon:yes gene_type:complete